MDKVFMPLQKNIFFLWVSVYMYAETHFSKIYDILYVIIHNIGYKHSQGKFSVRFLSDHEVKEKKYSLKVFQN